MQVTPAAAPGPMASAASSLVDQVRRQATILADDSGASHDQKVDAYIAISKAIVQSASTGSGWFQQSTQADRDAVNAVMDTASVAKEVRQAADDFNARGMRADRTTNVMANQLNYLDGLSDARQKMIFAGSASLEQTDTIEGWKGFLQHHADLREQMMAAEAAEQPAVKVTLSDTAKAALKASSADAPASLLNTKDQGVGIADVALKMLQDAAANRAEAQEKAKAADRIRIYEAGEQVDTSI